MTLAAILETDLRWVCKVSLFEYRGLSSSVWSYMHGDIIWIASPQETLFFVLPNLSQQFQKRKFKIHSPSRLGLSHRGLDALSFRPRKCHASNRELDEGGFPSGQTRNLLKIQQL